MGTESAINSSPIEGGIVGGIAGGGGLTGSTPDTDKTMPQDWESFVSQSTLYGQVFTPNGMFNDAYNRITDKYKYTNSNAGGKARTAERALKSVYDEHRLGVAMSMNGVPSQLVTQYYNDCMTLGGDEAGKKVLREIGQPVRDDLSFRSNLNNWVKTGKYKSIYNMGQEYSDEFRKRVQDYRFMSPDLKQRYEIASQYSDMQDSQIDYILGQEMSLLDGLGKKFESILGEGWKTHPKMQGYLNTDEAKDYLNLGSTDNFVKHFAGEDKFNEAMSAIAQADNNGSYSNNTQYFGNLTITPRPEKRGINVFGPGGLLSGGSIGTVLKDMGKFVLETAFDAATSSYDWIVDIGEGVDDLIDGKDFWDTVGDTGKKIAGIDVLEDAYGYFQQGDIVGGMLKVGEFSAQYGGGSGGIDGGGMDTGTANAITEAFLKNLDEASLEHTDLAKLREDINTQLGGGPIPEPDIDTEVKVPQIEKTSMDELKKLLGVMTDKEVIDSLVGEEARKLADTPEIAKVLGLQSQVADTGYDAGEREALSSKARRELAGMARQSGAAAGAAAGGMRGASVGAQARSLAEAAMQKQADVTTEMDKGAIARKDAARQELAKLAQDVNKFDIEKEEERKKRKGATTIGVQSLLSQEEMAKLQMELANQ